MSDAVIGALITAVGAIICQILIARSQAKSRKVDEAVRDALLDERLKNIEHKLDIHNGYAEKLGDISTSIAVIQNDIKTLYKHGGV